MDDITSSLIRIIPSLLVWVIGLVLSIKMLRRGGSKPEKLLLAGCSLILINTILNPFTRILLETWMNQEDLSFSSISGMMVWISIPRGIISLAGFICLVMAFWIKFKVKKPGVT